ncbi:MAG: hypothetical protein LBQ55_03395 [Treponema sp.]|jgi:hypothetical protein|nr:hypothetical protein [Treponema sp.]
MALPDLWSKLKEGGAKAGALLKGLGGKAAPVSAAARELWRRSGWKLPQGGQRLVFIGFGAFLAALLLLLLILLAVPRGGSERRAEAPPSRTIPPEDLFLPDEPDFVPSFIPGRERRESWTGEDAAAYWQDPLNGALNRGEEEWRNRIESVIDKLLEHVP